jgi:osmoprotectant transport system substrate-binding protein
MKRRALLAGLPLAAFVWGGCRAGREERIVVGCKNFTEQVVLGELLAQQIEVRAGLPVDRRFYLAGSYIAHQALRSGRIDLYVEYTGTALTVILKEPPRSSAREVWERVRAGYSERFGLEVMEPLGFNNTFAIIVRGEDARREGLRTISDAARLAPQWRAGFGYEFMERPDGFAGLAETYQLRFGQPPRIMDLGLIYRALKEKQVDVVAGNSTDGLIAALDLAVLEDDKAYFPPYEAAPIVRRDALERVPALRSAIASLAGRVSEEDMRRMNYAVDGEHRDAREVVREFRKARGL